jgi:hypothetical protein
MAINTKSYIEEFVKIRDKNSHIVPFILNAPQLRLYDIISQQAKKRQPIRIIILKARQMGFSTVTGGVILKNTATKQNVTSAIVAHKEDSASNLFNMYKLMYDNLPLEIKPTKKASNAKELIFNNDNNTGLNSRIRCMTAGAQGIGRSFTINYLHISELAFWEGNPKETLLGLFQAVPNTPDSMIIIESTANGFETFKDMWDAAVNGESDFYPLFVGWNELEQYQMPYDGSILSPEEVELMNRYHLTREQIMWRRWCIKNNCGGDVDMFKQEYPITPQEAFLATGRCVFNQENIENRLNNLPEPIRRGEFKYTNTGITLKDIQFVDDERGSIRIWEEPRPNHKYVIGADTAGEGSDYFYAHVLDNFDGKQVAVYRCPTDETLFTHQMYCLGMLYNEALIAIETNFSTYPNKELERLRYPRIFVRQREDNFTHNITESFGFRTTMQTRPIIISMITDVIRECPEMINDRILLNECLTFVRNDRGRAEAMEGKHDDAVISYGIALYARGQQVMVLPEETKPRKLFKWSDDLKQDYYKADKETRERMREKYGDPN